MFCNRDLKVDSVGELTWHGNAFQILTTRYLN